MTQIVVYADKSSYIYQFWANGFQIVVYANNFCTSLCTIFTDTNTNICMVFWHVIETLLQDLVTFC